MTNFPVNRPMVALMWKVGEAIFGAAPNLPIIQMGQLGESGSNNVVKRHVVIALI